MSDNNQILRLLGTIREEVSGIRSRQEELYALLLTFKDQLQDVKTTVTSRLEGLPKSPYIAGQLIPAPDKVEGVDDFRQMLATYLHKHTPADPKDGPVDLVFEKPAEIKPEEIELEEDETAEPRRRGGRRPGGGGGGGGRDNDLERGPDRGVERIDLIQDDEDSDDGDSDDGEKAPAAKAGEGATRAAGGGGGGRRRRRGGRGRRKGPGGGGGGGD